MDHFPEHKNMRKLLLYSFDLMVVALSPFAALAIRDNFALNSVNVENILPYSLTGIVVALFVLMISGSYRGIWRHTSLSDIVRLITSITVSVIITVVIMSLATRLEGIARSVPLIQWAILVMVLGASRIGLRLFLRHRHRGEKKKTATEIYKEHVLVVGVDHIAELYLRCVSDLASHKITVEGILDEAKTVQGRRIGSCKVIGHPADLPSVLETLNVHGVTITRIVVAMPFADLTKKSRETLLHWEQTGNITLEMFEEKLGFGTDDTTEIRSWKVKAKTPVFLSSTSLDKQQECGAQDALLGYATLKRMIDILGASVLLVVLSPLVAITSLLVALDVGLPLLFWQLRPGCQGRPFRVYKFRTMRAGHDGAGNRIPDEERQSRLGWFLRRTRMDELPQLYHILVGEMSFVGPRPLLSVDLPTDQPDLVAIRNSIRPGLTGWAQVHGGKDVSIEDKAVLDVWYREHMSLTLDIKIILKTVVMVITGEKLDRAVIRQAYQDLGMPRVLSIAATSKMTENGDGDYLSVA